MKLMIFWLLSVLVCTVSVQADPFVDSVVEVNYGSSAGFGQDEFPDIILGPPRGGGEFAGSLDVLSLGDGGSITLEFTDNLVTNGPGPDLIVFENAFYVSQSPQNTFNEVAFVEVSQDGVNFVRFPNDYNPEGEPIHDPLNWSGFAGVYPCLSNTNNGIDPTDPTVSGGDFFDLEDLGLDTIRFIRIVDTNEPPDAETDDDGDEIYDQGWGGGNSAGFDLDAVAAVYSEDLTTPTPSPTATPEAPPTVLPTGTPVPDCCEMDLILSGHTFYPGDRFLLDAELNNPASKNKDLGVFIVLEVHGTYFFWPEWDREINGEWMNLPNGMTPISIFDFTWPDTGTHSKGLIFWGVLLDDTGTITSDIEKEEFSYY